MQPAELAGALEPLRARCAQLAAQLRAAQGRALAQYEHGERPSLKEHARSLKDTLAILTVEEAALRARLEGMASRQLASDPSVSTGFNVISSGLTDRSGAPLSLEELKKERARLVDALAALNGQIAAAKAEITRQRRREDAEIWETQLVALQDTKRVYRDEINLVEVELLGREHSERIHAERRAAERSGEAQLQRLQDQMVQTRVKMNRAKYQYYYPNVKGFNIRFGGAGIYGACSNIDISEIHGYLTVKAEVGSPAAADAPERPSRLVIQLEAAKGGSSTGAARPAEQQRQQQQPGPPAAPPPVRRAESAGTPLPAPANGQQPQPQQRGPPGPAATTVRGIGRSFTEPTRETPGDAAAVAARLQHASMSANGSAQQQGTLRKPVRTGDAAGSATPRGANSAGAGASPAAAALGQSPSRVHGRPPPSPRSTSLVQQAQQQAQQQPTKPKGNVAMRFLKSIGSKKDKYQSKDRLGGLRPLVSEDVEAGSSSGSTKGGGKMRTLADKLLHRGKSSRGLTGADSRGSLAPLEFGGHALGKHASSRSAFGGSIDEEASMHYSESVADDLSEAAVDDDAGLEAPEGAANMIVEGDGSLASEGEDSEEAAGAAAAAELDGEGDGPGSPLTREMLQAAEDRRGSRGVGAGAPQQQQADARTVGSSSSGPGSWLYGARSGGGGGGSCTAQAVGGSKMDSSSAAEEDDASSVASLGDWMAADAAAAEPPGGGGVHAKGCFVTGRLNGFELTGEKGTKCPNLSIGQADVRARVFCRFAFEYSSAKGWYQAGKEDAVFDVQHLTYKLKGNNVPMPSSVVKQLLRVFIGDIIWRRLQGLFPKELGDYLLNAGRGCELGADVALVGPALAVLDADLAFEVRGPARSTKEAKKQQHKYAAAKEARSLLGLSLPQAQILGELMGGRAALVDPPRPASISSLVAWLAAWDGHPHLYHEACQVWGTAYAVLAQGRRGAGDLNFRAFMDGPVSRLRRKPARARVIVRSLDVGLNADALVTLIHDYTQRTLEELFIKGPQSNARDNPEYCVESMDEQLEVLHAWHAWVLRELSHFKSKFRGAAATLLGAGDKGGFSMGVENAHYEGPLRLRLPVSMQLDADGAFSFEIPLPGPSGSIGLFMDAFKAMTVPAHLRPPAAAVNWAELTGDSEVTKAMQGRLGAALEAIQGVLDELNSRIKDGGLHAEDADPTKVLTQPRTMVGDRLGRLIVSRLKVRVRLDERRIGEILQGIDAASMGPAFVSTAGRMLGHLGDVMTLGFTPAAPSPATASPGPQQRQQQQPSQYLFQFESSDISRLRADVQALGFVSAVTPGGVVRLAHAIIRAFLLAFRGQGPGELAELRQRYETWYRAMTREGLEISICVDARAALESGACLLRLSGTADDASLRTTSPAVVTQDLELKVLGQAMRGDFRQQPRPADGQAAARQGASART